MDASEMETLFARTLGEYDGKDAWTAIRELRTNGSREIFDYAASWCSSDSALKRARAANVLCQLQPPLTPGEKPQSQPMFRDESYSLIAKMLEAERDSMVLDSAIHALGHLHNPSAVPQILHCQDHPEEQVRFAVAFALGCFPDDPQSVQGLLKLTSDTAARIRDWAVFGLGAQGNEDSSAIREALLRRLDDTDEDVREEAAVGLGKRRDRRLLPKLLAMLDAPEIKVRVAEAAVALLGLDRDNPEWVAEDYKAALTSKFRT